MSNSLSTNHKSSHAPLAALRAPSTRDIDIYKRVKIVGALQESVAWHYKIDTSRVSQIVKKVRRWLAAGGAVTDPQVRDHAARQSLSKATHMLRLQRAIEQVTFAMENDRPLQKSIRSRIVSGVEVWREETSKPAPEVDLKAIRLLLRLTESLHKFQDSEEVPQASAKQRKLFELDLICEQDLIDSVFEHLCRWRTSVEANGRLPASGNIKALVAGAMDTVLGTNLAADFEATSPGSGVDCAGPPSTPTNDNRNRLPTPSLSDADSSSLAETPSSATVSSPPEPSVHETLNMSAPPLHPVSTSDAPSTPCDQPTPPAPEKNLQHERPAEHSNPSFAETQLLGSPTLPATALSALACLLLCLSGLLASALGGFPQPTAKSLHKASSQWNLQHDNGQKLTASNPPHRPRDGIDLVRTSKPEQINRHKAATSGRGLPASKDRGHHMRHGSSPRPNGLASRRPLPRREA